MPGLDPGIHVLPSPNKKGADGRVIFAKTRFALLPGHDEECAAPLYDGATQRAVSRIKRI
jgi:hypothetical protein